MSLRLLSPVDPPSVPTITSLAPTHLRVDLANYPRWVHHGTVVEYAQDMRSGAEFPPVVAFYDGRDYWLADGLLRTEAAKRLPGREIAADVRPGTHRDAILFAVGANSDRGKRRDRSEMRRAVTILLSDPEWRQWSDRAIAEKCAVSHPFVATIRRELVTVTSHEPATRIGLDGVTRALPHPKTPIEEAAGDRVVAAIGRLACELEMLIEQAPFELNVRERARAALAELIGCAKALQTPR